MATYALLTQPSANPKVSKNLTKGVYTAPLHLAPADSSGYEVCPMRSQGCTAACLHTAGNPMYLANKIKARNRKTKLYFEDRKEFLRLLVKDIEKLRNAAEKSNMICGVRLNATSDIQWERVRIEHEGNTYANLMELFPDVQFYDYTKIINRLRKPLPKNYHLTFSKAEDNDKACKEALSLGCNVAVVFDTKEFPKEFWGCHIVNGDEHDYRPADTLEKPEGYTKGLIVGLKAKGKAKQDTSGFVVHT